MRADDIGWRFARWEFRRFVLLLGIAIWCDIFRFLRSRWGYVILAANFRVGLSRSLFRICYQLEILRFKMRRAALNRFCDISQIQNYGVQYRRHLD